MADDLRRPASIFERFSLRVTEWAGSTPAFFLALGVILAWIASSSSS